MAETPTDDILQDKIAVFLTRAMAVRQKNDIMQL
jgi:hypothetical protein